MSRISGVIIALVAVLATSLVVNQRVANAAPGDDLAVAATWVTERQGSTGPNVSTIQWLLRSHGISVTVDGQFGSQTHSAVRTFQSRNGLYVDGIVGSQTWPKLVRYLTQGASGAAVSGLQVQLRKNGHTVAVDGQFGPQTASAVKAFKTRVGLTANSVADTATWRELVGRANGGGGYLPVPRSTVTRGDLDNPHHDYPAIDIIVSYVPAYAGFRGTVHNFSSTSCGIGVQIRLGGYNRVNYCHLASRTVSEGQTVNPGTRIGTTGQTGNAQYSVPHLHMEIRTSTSAGVLRCPQPWLLAVWDGRTPPSVTSLPTSGCYF